MHRIITSRNVRNLIPFVWGVGRRDAEYRPITSNGVSNWNLKLLFGAIVEFYPTNHEGFFRRT